MVEEIKREMRRLEYLIGCKKRIEITSEEFMKELMATLNSKYKEDVQRKIRLHRLDFFHDLLQKAHGRRAVLGGIHGDVRVDRRRGQKEEDKKKKNEKDEDEEKDLDEPPEAKKSVGSTQEDDDDARVRAEDVDNWRDALSLSKVHYILEHPTSRCLTFERRNSASGIFTDMDLVEWNAAQLIRLRMLEEWAVSRLDARRLASHLDLDDPEDNETSKLEELFDSLDTGTKKTKMVKKLENVLAEKRPFKFKDESMEDWTENYSDDSDESGEELFIETAIEIDQEEKEEMLPDQSEVEKESMEEEEIEKLIPEVFSTVTEYPEYRNPVFDKMENAKTMEEWYAISQNAIGSVDTPVESEESPVQRRKTRVYIDKTPLETIPSESFSVEDADIEGAVVVDTHVEDEINSKLRGYIEIMLKEGRKSVVEGRPERKVDALKVEGSSEGNELYEDVDACLQNLLNAIQKEGRKRMTHEDPEDTQQIEMLHEDDQELSAEEDASLQSYIQNVLKEGRMSVIQKEGRPDTETVIDDFERRKMQSGQAHDSAVDREVKKLDSDHPDKEKNHEMEETNEDKFPDAVSDPSLQSYIENVLREGRKSVIQKQNGEKNTEN